MSSTGQSLPRPLAIAGAGVTALLSLVVGLPVIALLGLSGPGGSTGASTADAATLDAWMAQQVPGSPLVGLGAIFVSEGERNGIDPRALVAIAMHESVLGTAGSGAAIHNAFGWGPAIAFPSWQENIATVARGLAQGYTARGRDTLAAIQPVWAPLGAANDPAGLNSAWVDAVGRYYKDMGGDPRASIAFVPAVSDGQAALCPVGPWGGTERPVEALARLTGLPVTSAKRTRQMTASGGTSDHWVGCAKCFANDLGTTPPAGDALASRIASAIGGPGYANWGSTGGVLNVERCGIRFQLLWRTYVGGNHWNHIHIGARLVGYAP
ncbi:glucosaminidase domain-containing protein [Miltoncostaea oceani]|uniref:glucosaminidase domain-containing protein n=1 Tax=Miltoncostaea oceani TaxID=2843216 RepID=UPI001C3C5805|nr:glucosaminidase domain-containing protein [Miltoncostaea oceani]